MEDDDVESGDRRQGYGREAPCFCITRCFSDSHISANTVNARGHGYSTEYS